MVKKFLCCCLLLGSSLIGNAQDLSDLVRKALHIVESREMGEDEMVDSVEVEIISEELVDLDSLETSIENYVDSSTVEEPILSDLQRLYQKNAFQTIWYNDRSLLIKSEGLLEILSATYEHGLLPIRYNYAFLDSIYQSLNTDKLNMRDLSEEDYENIVAFDIICSKFALKLAKDLRFGVLEPSKLPHQWEIPRDELDIVPLLYKAIETNELQGFYEEMAPQNEYYKRLAASLKIFQKRVEADTNKVLLKTPQKLELGDTGQQVLLLKKRLAFFYELPQDTLPNKEQTNYSPVNYQEDSIVNNTKTAYIFESNLCQDTIFYTSDSFKIMTDSSQYSFVDTLSMEIDTLTLTKDSLLAEVEMVYDSAYFDSTLLKYVKKFQYDYGLKADGIVGPNTIAKLNGSLDNQLKQIEINLERWRWLPRDIGGDYILVNVAGFYLDVFEQDSSKLNKKVMVGTPRTKTPIFSNMMQYIELNPYWTVPYSIATREMLPKIKKDPGYLARNNYKLLSGGKAVNPYAVDWTNVKRGSFPYIIRQNPGSNNALGEIKFMFPNRYSVYLHDTQSKDKFVEPSRAFSHGCVRLEKPMELAEYLFRKDNKYTPEKLDQLLKKRKNKRIDLEKPIPIYLLYWTAWVDRSGKLHLQEDVYKRDNALVELWGNWGRRRTDM